MPAPLTSPLSTPAHHFLIRGPLAPLKVFPVKSFSVPATWLAALTPSALWRCLVGGQPSEEQMVIVEVGQDPFLFVA